MAFPTLPHLDRSALLALLGDQSDDVLQTLCRTIAQAAINAEFTEHIGAERYERAGERMYRNGTRSRTLNTRLGTVDLMIPRPREGGYIPSFIEERKRSEKALVAAVIEMGINAASSFQRPSDATKGRLRARHAVARDRKLALHVTPESRPASRVAVGL